MPTRGEHLGSLVDVADNSLDHLLGMDFIQNHCGENPNFGRKQVDIDIQK